jgi:hypothetical protein
LSEQPASVRKLPFAYQYRDVVGCVTAGAAAPGTATAAAGVGTFTLVAAEAEVSGRLATCTGAAVEVGYVLVPPGRYGCAVATAAAGDTFVAAGVGDVAAGVGVGDVMPETYRPGEYGEALAACWTAVAAPPIVGKLGVVAADCVAPAASPTAPVKRLA